MWVSWKVGQDYATQPGGEESLKRHDYINYMWDGLPPIATAICTYSQGLMKVTNWKVRFFFSFSALRERLAQPTMKTTQSSLIKCSVIKPLSAWDGETTVYFVTSQGVNIKKLQCRSSCENNRVKVSWGSTIQYDTWPLCQYYLKYYVWP